MNLKLTAAILALVVSAATVRAGETAELPKPDAEGWITLFNGKDLTGWEGNPDIWRVTDGYISGKIDKIGYNTFLVYPHPFKDFVIEFKFVLVDNKGNSGLQYRSKVHDKAKFVVGGYQADIGQGWFGSLYEERGRGILFKAEKERAPELKPNNEWNTFVVTAQGNKLKQELNGKLTGEYEDKDEAKRAMEGIFALQYHAPGGFEVRFKDIRVKPIEAK